MGREIRMVPPKWEDNHPKDKNYADGRLQPMYDESFFTAVRDWKEGYQQWATGSHPNYDDGLEYWEWDYPPKREYYRPWKDKEAIWFQVWETVSEGTPISPSFATKEELINYLANCGDDWSDKGWGMEAAKKFVEQGRCVTFVVTNMPGDVSIRHGYE